MTGASEAPFEDARGVCAAKIETTQTFLSPERASAMVDEFVDGATKESLARKYGVHVQTVQAHVCQAGAVQPGRVGDDVLADFASGVPTTVLAKRCGVSRDTIRRHAKRAGVEAGEWAIPQDDVDHIVELYGQREPIVDIAGQLGLGHRKVRRVLVDAGVTIRSPGHRPRLDGRRVELERLRGQGWSYARIGQQLGVGKSTVRDHVVRWAACSSQYCRLRRSSGV
ncbi:MAG: hypothetical protein FWF43_09930 [Propionibacteriaceae bacterium]|nr:hypothetical protein [Propionibacteriaceae bacterium]